jgi:hypothetical protein
MLLLKPTAVALDPATTAWVSAVVASGGTVSGARQTVVNNLIVGLKADGIWTKLDRLWIFAAENTQSALIDLFALAEALPSGIPPTFTADRGYAGNGSNSFVRTFFRPATHGVAWTLNSAHIAVWDNTDRAEADTVATGVYDSTLGASGTYSDLQPFYASGMRSRINGTTAPILANSTSQGFFIGQRNDSSTIEGFYNGVSVETDVSSATGVIDLPMYICARDDDATPAFFSTDQISMTSYGGKFTSTEALAYYNRLRTYMTAVGVP